MRAIKILLLLSVLLAFLGSAETKALTNQDIGEAQSVAKRFFTPKCSSVRVVTGTASSEVDGEAWLAECEVHLHSSWPQWEFTRLCSTMVHEYGHLHRMDGWHSPDPNHPLHSPAPYLYECAYRDRAREARAARYDRLLNAYDTVREDIRYWREEVRRCSSRPCKRRMRSRVRRLKRRALRLQRSLTHLKALNENND